VDTLIGLSSFDLSVDFSIVVSFTRVRSCATLESSALPPKRIHLPAEPQKPSYFNSLTAAAQRVHDPETPPESLFF
jgi:hypothetical protein